MTRVDEQIVVSGVGLATSLGLDLETTWRGVCERRCGIGPMSAIEQRPDPDKGGGQADDLPGDFLTNQAREVRYLRWVLAQALSHAGIESVGSSRPARLGLILCTTLHGMRSGGQFLRTDDLRHLKSFLAGHAAGALAGALGGVALMTTTCSSCASALSGVGLGMTWLRAGEADAVIVAGYDAVSEYVYAGFNSLRLVADGPPRPFSSDRQGMKVAEGYAAIVMEPACTATGRGASPFVRLLGHGEASDAHHLTQPHPSGRGASRAISSALADAGMAPGDVGLISAHATATPNNDAAEHAALVDVFGPSLRQIPVVAFKAAVGHTLGSAGVVELILCGAALRDQVVPPTPNVSADELEFSDIHLVTSDRAQPRSIRAAITSSLGFGGTNASVVLAPAVVSQDTASSGTQQDIGATASVNALDAGRLFQQHDEVWVTGLGLVMPGAIGNEAFTALLADGPEPDQDIATEPIGDHELDGLIHAKRMRRMSAYVKLTLAATRLACQDAGISVGDEICHDCSAMLGTTHGSTRYCEQYYRQVVEEGIDAANPVLFAEGVPNAAAAHLSLALGLRGSCQTIIGSRASGLDALMLAAARIRGGQWDRAIVSVAEEHSELVIRAYRGGAFDASHRRGGAGSEFRIGSGAVTMILESARAARSRKARARGRIDRWLAVGGSSLLDRKVLAEAGRRIRVEGFSRQFIGSGGGPVIDRVERRVACRASAMPGRESLPSELEHSWVSTYRYFGETFSVGPLLGMTAALLTPRFVRQPLLATRASCDRHGGDFGSDSVGRPGPFNESKTLLCAGVEGSVVAVEFTPVQDHD